MNHLRGPWGIGTVPGCLVPGSGVLGQEKSDRGVTDEVARAAGSGVAALHVDSVLSGEAREGLAPTGAPPGSRPVFVHRTRSHTGHMI